MPVQAQAALAEGEIALDLLGNDLKGSIQKGQSRDRAVSVNSTAQDVVSVKLKSAKARLDSYKATSDALLQVLDAVAELHPFISVAALPFKAAIKIVLNKKANDKSVLVLFVEMSDMMSSLVLLRAVKPDQRDYEGTSLVVRLDKCLCAVAKEIERCAAACATYEKQKYIVKLVKNGEWEDSLKAFTEAFHGHKERIQWEISVHVGITIDELKSSVGEFAAMIRSTDSNSSMVLLMRQLRSPGERELQDFIKSKGGPDRFLKDEKAMQELTLRASGVEGFGNTKVLSPKEQEEVIREMTRDLKKSFFSMVKEDEDRFTNLFKLYQGRISSDMRTESDRIINVLNAGAHEKIQDPDLHGLWKDMGWKGTTKARHLVMALRELYVERHKTAMSAQHNALNTIRDIASPSNPQPDSVKVQEIAEVTKTDVQLEDSWALQYISIPRIQPLLEAFDDDGSSLVSVTEVNAFTAAKPQAWSLPRWMAYWTAGFPLSLKYYYNRIQLLLARIAMVSRNVLPTNKNLVDEFNKDGNATINVDKLLAGVHSAAQELDRDDPTFQRFIDYVNHEELRMADTLKTIAYYMDSRDTLDLLTGSGRLEKSLLPLIYLLFQRTLQVMKEGCKFTLHRKEILNLIGSFRTIWEAAQYRVNSMKALYRLQNLNTRDQLSKFSYGLYLYVEFPQDWESSHYFTALYRSEVSETTIIFNRRYLWCHFEVSDIGYADVSSLEEREDEKVVLAFGPQEDELESDLKDTLRVDGIYESPSVAPVDRRSPQTGSVSGSWRGFYSYISQPTKQYPAGVSTISLPPIGVDTGPVQGGGVDTIGDFIIRGIVSGSYFSVNKEYLDNLDADSDAPRKLAWRYEGTINSDRDQIHGYWGNPDDVRDDFQKRLDKQSVQGMFEHRKVPEYSFHAFKPSQEELTSNKPLSLWRFAIRSVCYQSIIKSGNLNWAYLKQRRRVRKRMVALTLRQHSELYGWGYINEKDPLTTAESLELETLVAMCSQQDLAFYHSLVLYQQRREIVHHGVNCDNCASSRLKMTRLTCLDCFTGDPDTTVDMCAACIQATISREAGKVRHLPSHALLQMRRSIPMRERYPVIKEALKMLQAARERPQINGTEPKRTCYNCNEPLEETMWRCVDCSDVSLCTRCNLADNEFPPTVYNTRTQEYLSSYISVQAATTMQQAPRAKGFPDFDGEPEHIMNDETEGVTEEITCDTEDTGGVRDSSENDESQKTDTDDKASEESSKGDESDYSRTPHLWTHNLVLLQPSQRSLQSEPRIVPSNDQLGDLKERMDRLEALLIQIVSAVGPAPR